MNLMVYVQMLSALYIHAERLIDLSNDCRYGELGRRGIYDFHDMYRLLGVRRNPALARKLVASLPVRFPIDFSNYHRFFIGFSLVFRRLSIDFSLISPLTKTLNSLQDTSWLKKNKNMLTGDFDKFGDSVSDISTFYIAKFIIYDQKVYRF